MTLVAAPPRTHAAAPGALASVRAVIRRGLRDQRRAALIWGAPLGAMCALMAALWPSIEGSMDELMRSYPEQLKQAFNIHALTSVEAYVDAEMLSLIMPLAVAFLAVRIVVSTLSGAEELGHLDIALSAPLARGVLAAGALVVAAVTVAEVLAVVLALTWVAGELAGADPSLVVLGRGMANVWPLAMLFAGLAVLGCGWLHRGAPVTALAAGTLVGMYVLDLVGKLAEPIRPLRALSAFKYYGSAIQHGIDPLAFAGLALLGVGLAAVGALMLERRDIF
jgi:ABC-2 type transport system permease protein